MRHKEVQRFQVPVRKALRVNLPHAFDKVPGEREFQWDILPTSRELERLSRAHRCSEPCMERVSGAQLHLNKEHRAVHCLATLLELMLLHSCLNSLCGTRLWGGDIPALTQRTMAAARGELEQMVFGRFTHEGEVSGALFERKTAAQRDPGTGRPSKVTRLGVHVGLQVCPRWPVITALSQRLWKALRLLAPTSVISHHVPRITFCYLRQVRNFTEVSVGPHILVLGQIDGHQLHCIPFVFQAMPSPVDGSKPTSPNE
mmetsp:Transcript_52785/g.140897  ORF Transcript_52785/g.140897 Transcript_52785/m.140897 type:complete len:258 (+) Transcript_52785:623-1396(+)